MRAFGERVFDVIEEEPGRLREVDGIGPVRAKRITEAWAEQKVVREIMVFLHSHGVGTARAVRIFKTYGVDAVQVMTENPYRLARDIRGIGFKTADAIAMRLGIEKTAMIRVRAGIAYALSEAMDDGHCGLPEEKLVPMAAELLEAPEDLVRTARDLELADGTVVAAAVAGTPCLFLAGLSPGRTGHRGTYPADRGGSAPMAGDRPGQGPALGRAAHRPVAGGQPGRRRSPRPDVEGHGRHRRTGGGQDDPHERHPAHPGRQGRVKHGCCARRPAAPPSG